jgi:ammonium transporter, Amt family
VDVSQLGQIVDSGWLFLAAALVFFMRAGFLALEAGLTQRKNSANTATKNLVDLAIAATFFWLYGFGIMFGQTNASSMFGTGRFSPDFLGLFADPATRESALGTIAFFFYQIMFANTAVVILSGATAERLRFESYLIISAVVSGLIYPLFGHWAWNGIDTGVMGGWLGSRGFVDLAGSAVVHSIGAWASLAALVVIGPRKGRFNADGTANEFPKANLPLAVIGTFMLWFGWFGFNGGSALLTQGNVGVILTNTLMAGIAGLVAVLPAQILFNDGVVRADYLMNGALVGLVSITASAHAVSTPGAFTIGLLGGWIMLALDWLLVRLQIDDAVGAVPVHLGGGIWAPWP